MTLQWQATPPEPGGNTGYDCWSKWCGAARQMGRAQCPHHTHSGHFLWTAVVSSSRRWECGGSSSGAHLAWISHRCVVCVPSAMQGQTWGLVPDCASVSSYQAHAGTTAVPSVWLEGHENPLATSARCFCYLDTGSNSSVNRWISWTDSCQCMTLVLNLNVLLRVRK